MSEIIRLTIKGQKYVATFVEASQGFGPYYRVVRQERPTDNLRGGYVVRVDETGRPLVCSCPDCQRHSRPRCPNIGVKWCKHMKALDALYLANQRRFQEEALRHGIVVSKTDNRSGEYDRTVPCERAEPSERTAPSERLAAPPQTHHDFVAMKVGEVHQIGCHRVERLASAWQVDERLAITWNQLCGLLAQPEPCTVPPVDPSRPDDPFARVPDDYLGGF